MENFVESLQEAIRLILALDGDVFGIIALTLMITIISTMISCILGIPAGTYLGSSEFKLKKIILRLVSTLMGLPPVVAGLVVYIILSRKGPLGSFGLLFTPGAMVIAQVIILLPIVIGLSAASVKLKSDSIKETCFGLGLGHVQRVKLLVYECRYPLFSAVLAAYGRAISEVGAVMLVGGNIEHHTRVMTTAIVLETGKGMYERALALGLILLTISFIANWVVQYFQEAA